MMHFTAILALCASTALASNKAAIRVASKERFAKRSQVSMWHTGDEKPVAPSEEAGCFTESSYWYDDSTFCWQEWDSYCGPNWEFDQECVDVENAYQESKNSASSECPSAPLLPTMFCFTEQAYNYDDSECGTIWRNFDQYCWNVPDGCPEPFCAQVNQEYSNYIADQTFSGGEEESTDETTDDSGMLVDIINNPCGEDSVPQIPGETCFTNEFYNYNGEGECPSIWRDWDSYCWNICQSDARCTQTNTDYFNYINGVNTEAQLTQPSGECFTRDAWNYNSNTSCDQIWRDWDEWCRNQTENEGKDLCAEVESDYQAAVNGTMVMRTAKQRSAKHFVLSKRAATNHARAQSNSRFNSGVVAGATIGSVSAAVMLFAISRCAKKSTSDDFERV